MSTIAVENNEAEWGFLWWISAGTSNGELATYTKNKLLKINKKNSSLKDLF